MEAIAGQTTQALPHRPNVPMGKVTGHVGEGEFSYAQARGDGRSRELVILWATQHETILELGDELGVKAHQPRFKGFELGAATQVAVEGNPQHTGRFPADLDACEVQACSRLSNGRCRSLRAWPVVGHAEMFADLVTVRLVHHTEHDLVEVDIGTNA